MKAEWLVEYSAAEMVGAKAVWLVASWVAPLVGETAGSLAGS